eukprot:356295-Pelagomonas_calceolata.AAC.1
MQEPTKVSLIACSKGCKGCRTRMPGMLTTDTCYVPSINHQPLNMTCRLDQHQLSVCPVIAGWGPALGGLIRFISCGYLLDIALYNLSDPSAVRDFFLILNGDLRQVRSHLRRRTPQPIGWARGRRGPGFTWIYTGNLQPEPLADRLL